ncbi:caspase domain-containing protein [Dactylonectria estremocensis]|uniref:Caspase domain-containing protein n=1 Tax=Dactylonectria estremocensis TaxID=1079267 RepID=A0A9P9FEQ9_9HYPO|nr:caspase domain-containing protein [Dactylonectria estremocensis]
MSEAEQEPRCTICRVRLQSRPSRGKSVRPDEQIPSWRQRACCIEQWRTRGAVRDRISAFGCAVHAVPRERTVCQGRRGVGREELGVRLGEESVQLIEPEPEPGVLGGLLVPTLDPIPIISTEYLRPAKLRLMDRQEPARSYHALLVGIDCYSREPLEGAVRDAKAISAYLEKRHDLVQIRTLTATPPGGSDATTPVEDPGMWPTYENVTAALDDIAARAEPGDCAFMHFSGHGTRMAATRAFANEATGELALNLLTSDGRGIRYLRGEELASSLKRIVAKGVLVTVVLDCCFSGSVLRRGHSFTVRELSYDLAIDQRYPADPALYADPASDSGSPVRRDGSSAPNWLINPDGYTIMTACGPHELAHEDALDGKEKHGILSYFLLRTLAMWEETRAPQLDMYRHICARFKERWPHQNPMLFGNKSLSFFADHDKLADDAHTFVVSTEEAGIRLQVGRAHGVSKGDLFSLFSTRSATGTSIAAEVPARVEKVGNLTSTLAFPDSAAESSVKGIQTGWAAKQVTRQLLRQLPIRLAHDLPNLADVSAALQSRGSLDPQVSGSGTEDYSFLVKMDADENYVILDGRHQPLPNVPVISALMEDGIPRLLDILEHLAKFKLVKGLANSNNSLFQNSFEAQLFTPSGEFTANQVARVTTGDQVAFKVQNVGNRALYIHIYDMGPRWHIQSVVGGEYHVLPPRKPLEGYSGTLRTKLRMELPPELEEAGQEVCEDVLKVFITTRQTSFLSLELPRLGASVTELKRPSHSRTSSGDVEDDLTEDWATLEFTIRTSAK